MAMRKVYYGPEGITLKHIMCCYDKASLLDYAKTLEIRRVSGLKKDELAEKIANELLAPSVIRRRMAVFSKEQRELLERAMKQPFVPTEDEMEDTLWLHEHDYAFLNKARMLNVPVDVAKAYEKLNTPDFRNYAKKMSWLSQCLSFGENFYGIFEKKVLLEVFNTRKGYHITIDELEKLCGDFPPDMTECHVERNQRFVIAEYLAYNGEYKDLLDIQAGKEFYIPNYGEVLDYAKNLYLSEEPAYRRLRDFFQNKLELSYREADDETADIVEKISRGEDFQDIFQYILDVCEDSVDDVLIDEIVPLLQNANNHTRMQIHRGHTPDEMMQIEMEKGYGKRPVVVPGSTDAANLLKNASAELESMGIKVDLESNAKMVPNEIGKKVYPNDPCPCGSGKKYKKCCGR